MTDADIDKLNRALAPIEPSLKLGNVPCEIEAQLERIEASIRALRRAWISAFGYTDCSPADDDDEGGARSS